DSPLVRPRRSRDGLRASAGGRVHVVTRRDGRRDARVGEVLMATTITMPQLGETVTEGTVAQWLKKVGDSVDKYEAFVEVSTDKANVEARSPFAGPIPEVLVKEGEPVATGTPIAVIDEVGAAAASVPAPAAPSHAPSPAPAPQPAAHAPASSNGAGKANAVSG